MTWARAPLGTSCSAFALRKNLGLEIVAGVAGGPEGALRRVNWISKPPLLRRFGTALRSFVRHLCNTEISPAEPIRHALVGAESVPSATHFRSAFADS